MCSSLPVDSVTVVPAWRVTGAIAANPVSTPATAVVHCHPRSVFGCGIATTCPKPDIRPSSLARRSGRRVRHSLPAGQGDQIKAGGYTRRPREPSLPYVGGCIAHSARETEALSQDMGQKTQGRGTRSGSGAGDDERRQPEMFTDGDLNLDYRLGGIDGRDLLLAFEDL